MVGLREIPRTATFAWSSDISSPFLATGTKAGAVDEGFSNETQLELWDLDLDGDSLQQGRELKPAARISTDSRSVSGSSTIFSMRATRVLTVSFRIRFNDIAWTTGDNDHSRGIIAGALENGSLDLWDTDKLLSGDGLGLLSNAQIKVLPSPRDASKSRTSKHGGAIKALQFNAFRSELLATVGAKGEVCRPF